MFYESINLFIFYKYFLAINMLVFKFLNTGCSVIIIMHIKYSGVLFMKRLIILFLILFIFASSLSGCKGNTGKTNETVNPGVSSQVSQNSSSQDPMVSQSGGIAMITNGDTIDDHAFNAMLWSGLSKAGREFGFTPAFIEETGFSDEELLGGISTLYDGGNRLIFCPGISLSGAVNKARQMYSDLNLVMVDAVVDSSPNVVSTSFAIEQAGFLAGLASAVSLGDAEFGFLGGMEIPSVQKYNWGFQQGLAYANSAYGITSVIKEENVIYSGSFGDFMGGKSIAANMFDRGVDAILVAAGQTGMGAVEYAREKASDSSIWIICVDFDQYERGIHNGTDSVILTSAVKKYGAAAYELSPMYLNDSFPGGSEFRLDIMNDGVGIPDNNPNLSQAAADAVKAATAELKEGLIVVKDYPDGLIP